MRTAHAGKPGRAGMIDPAAVLAHPGLEVPYRFDARETMLHALSTGIGMDPVDTDRLPFVYDRGSVPLQPLPTLPIVLGWVDLVRDERSWNAALGIFGHRLRAAAQHGVGFG